MAGIRNETVHSVSYLLSALCCLLGFLQRAADRQLHDSQHPGQRLAVCKVETQGGSGLDTSTLYLPVEVAWGGFAARGQCSSELIKGAGGEELPEEAQTSRGC